MRFEVIIYIYIYIFALFVKLFCKVVNLVVSQFEWQLQVFLHSSLGMLLCPFLNHLAEV